MPSPLPLDQKLIDALRHAGPEADEQRRALLRERRVLFVMGSYAGKRKLHERARELGVRMSVLDGPGHWAASAPELFEQFIEVDLAGRETLLQRALAAIHATGLRFDAVATFEEFGGPLAAIIADHLHLPGHPPYAVGAARHKAFTRETCRDAGIPTPRFARLFSADDLETAAAEVGFPAVLKPVSGVASLAVYRVTSMAELRQRYDQNTLQAQQDSGASGVTSDNDPALTALTWGGGAEMLLEEFLDGEEFDVDCLLCEGELVYANLVRDLPQLYMVEVGSQIPPNFPEQRQAELVELARQVLAALGFRAGAFHVEVKYTSAGPRLIEVNARIGGGPVWDLHRRVWSVDLAEQYLMVQLGIPIRPAPAAQPLAYVITSDLPAPITGTITRDDFLAHLAGRPEVIAAYPKVRPGQRVIGSDSGVPEWLGEIIVQGESVAHAEQLMAAILAALELPILPD